MDLTADKWISSGGNAENARRMQNLQNVDELIRQIASFVHSPEGQEQFFHVFCRKAQMKAYAAKQHQIVLETESYYDDRSIRWSRITTQLIDNPTNGHVESILYGTDISKETSRVDELKMERMHALQEKANLEKQVKKAMDLYSRADHDRRYDFLTGLYSRLSLSDFLEKNRDETGHPVTAVIMLDLDDLKKTNDQYGHAAGDKCLRELGKTLLKFGVSNHIAFYRYGGDEFVGLTEDSDTDIAAVAANLEQELSKISLDVNGRRIPMTASIGYTAEIEDCSDMINQADAAMYLAKRRGKNQIASADSKATL